ncbi:MAG: hypothetical protein FWF15_02365, partial [Oscillospiraceae bacterium]|nr:hypothetical protein [Oscillospiraceae bacterium]
ITTEGTDYEIVFLNVEVLSSDMDTFPAGDYTFALYEAIWEYELRNINAKRNNSWPPSDLLTPAQKVISTWLGRGFPEINDYSKLEGREILTYNISITAFLHYIGADMTVETFSETVSKYFDIEDFEITDEDRYIKIEDGKYYPLAGAAGNMYYDFISESTENGITTVTVQFYADAMYLAKSHLIEYRLEDIGNGEYKIYCTNTLIKSKYPHLQWGV